MREKNSYQEAISYLDTRFLPIDQTVDREILRRIETFPFTPQDPFPQLEIFFRWISIYCESRAAKGLSGLTDSEAISFLADRLPHYMYPVIKQDRLNDPDKDY